MAQRRQKAASEPQVMSKENIEKLMNVKDTLADYWDIDASLNTLTARKVITHHDEEEIRACKTSQKRVNKFITLFVKKDNHAFEVFCNILEELNQRHISHLIKKNKSHPETTYKDNALNRKTAGEERSKVQNVKKNQNKKRKSSAESPLNQLNGKQKKSKINEDDNADTKDDDDNAKDDNDGAARRCSPNGRSDSLDDCTGSRKGATNNNDDGETEDNDDETEDNNDETEDNDDETEDNDDETEDNDDETEVNDDETEDNDDETGDDDGDIKEDSNEVEEAVDSNEVEKVANTRRQDNNKRTQPAEMKNIFPMDKLKERIGTGRESPFELRGRIMDIIDTIKIKDPQPQFPTTGKSKKKPVKKNIIMMCIVDDSNKHIRCTVYNRKGMFEKYMTRLGKLVRLEPLSYIVRKIIKKRDNDCSHQHPEFTLDLKRMPILLE